jgi:hypothetical protein
MKARWIGKKQYGDNTNRKLKHQQEQEDKQHSAKIHILVKN